MQSWSSFWRKSKTTNSFKSAGPGREAKAWPPGSPLPLTSGGAPSPPSLSYQGLPLPSLAATLSQPPPVGGQVGDSLGRGLVSGWWWDTTASGGEDASPPVHRGLGSSGLGLRGEAQGPANRQGGAQKLLKISRFRFQSICGARLLTLVALAFSLASAAVGLRWRPLS